MSAAKIPVVVVTAPPATPADGDVVIHLAQGLHEHAPGSECPACVAIGDVRVALYELLDAQRRGQRAPFSRVVVDASGVANVQPTLDRLSGKAPATALRDHVVARAFELVDAA